MLTDRELPPSQTPGERLSVGLRWSSLPPIDWPVFGELLQIVFFGVYLIVANIVRPVLARFGAFLVVIVLIDLPVGLRRCTEGARTSPWASFGP